MKCWSAQVGKRPHTVTVLERRDRRGIWLRWYIAGKPRYRRAAIEAVRDAAGQTDQLLIHAAEAEGEALSRELHGEKAAAFSPSPKPLTLARGLEVAFSARGCFPLDPATDRHTRECRKLVEEAIQQLRSLAARGKAGDLLWSEVTPGMVQGLWREDYASRGDGSGYRRAEKKVAALVTVCAHLADEFPGQRFPNPPRRWREALRAYWRKQGHDVDPKRPAHTRDEAAAIWANRHRTDPRVALAITLGAGLRGGQIVKTMRSDCRREDGSWLVQIPFTDGRKKAPWLYLTDIEREVFEAALFNGYLSELEEAFQQQRIRDYPLFPGGKLRAGKAPLREPLKPVCSSTLIHAFHELEEVAGVKPRKGRAWHGLRRDFALSLDRVREVDGVPFSEAERNEMGGWAPDSRMRESVYRSEMDLPRLKRLSQARRRLRERDGDGDAPSDTGRSPSQRSW